VKNYMDLVFGSGSDLGIVQMAARAVVIFVLALAMIRLSGRRSFGQHSSFDASMTVLLGAVLSRAVVGASPFFATVAAGLAVVVMHRTIAWISLRWPAFDRLISGSERVLVEGGIQDMESMRKALISERDLAEAMRKKFGADTQGPPARAVLERDGTVTLAKG
jgi:uncharacterized membrane protein YcaP (DUF421 family)